MAKKVEKFTNIPSSLFSKKRSEQKQVQTELNSELQLAYTIKKLRQVSGLKQAEIANIINIDQTRLSRIENGKQKLEVIQLIQLSEFFKVSLDNLVSSKVNFFQVAERFGSSLPIPEKYLNDRFTKMRDILPLLFFIDKKEGFDARESILKKLGIEGIFILDPNVDISIHFKLDLLRTIISNKILTQSNFQELITQTRSPQVHQFIHESFTGQENSLGLINNYILNSHMYDNNFLYSIKESSKKSILIKVAPLKHLENTAYEDSVLKNSICHIRSQMIQELPLYASLPIPSLKHKECHFHGDKQCVYEIKSIA